jgi:hypothetical protein
MSEDTARALKAPSPFVIKFGKKECSVRPLSLVELAEAERICIDQYRQDYLRVWREQTKDLPNGTQIYLDKVEMAAKWDVSDLPPKQAFDATLVKVTDELKRYLAEVFSLDQSALMDSRAKVLTVSLLDQKNLTVDMYKKLTGRSIQPLKIPYVGWWVTGSFDGSISFVWLCFRKYGVTKEEVMQKMSEDPALLAEVSRELERISSPDLKNG